MKLQPKPYHTPLILVLLSGIFLFLSLQKLHLPGYHSDEAFYAVPALGLLRPAPPGEGSAAFLMAGPYFGGTQTYFLLPFITLSGNVVLASRLMPIFFASLSIWLTWWVCAELFGRRVALLSSALLALGMGGALLSNTHVVLAKYAFLEETGERGQWSDAIYRLADYFERAAIARPAVLGHGGRTNIYVLTGGKVDPVLVRDDGSDPAAGQGYQVSPVTTFANRAGEPVYAVYRSRAFEKKREKA